MIIQYCSDLHLEFPDNLLYFKTHPIKPVGDILILTGDIMPFTELDNHSDFLDYLSDHFNTTYWLPGNHEYYGSDILHRSGSFIETLRSNVFLLNNESIVRQNYTLIFSTLWSSISPVAEWDIAKGMADYKRIHRGPERFRPLHSSRMHRACRQYVEDAVTKATTPKILVATHHVPTFLNYPPEYKGSDLNEAFATELFDFIEVLPINYWIYGHHHSNVPAFSIRNTQLLTNQLGYVKYGEQKGYLDAAVIG